MLFHPPGRKVNSCVAPFGSVTFLTTSSPLRLFVIVQVLLMIVTRAAVSLIAGAARLFGRGEIRTLFFTQDETQAWATLERERLALLAGTTVNYLYSIAGCHRPNTSAATAVSIEDATRALHAETKGRTQIITVRELATMCQLAGL